MKLTLLLGGLFWLSLGVVLGLFVAAAPISSPYAPQQAAMNNEWPPAKYRASKTITVTFVDTFEAVAAICGEAPEGWRTLGCHLGDGRVILPNPNLVPDYALERYSRLVGHELGHVNGWSGDHPA